LCERPGSTATSDSVCSDGACSHGGYGDGACNDGPCGAEARLALERASRDSVDAMLSLQHALLPMALPVLPQARLAARYQAAGHADTAGGDWFDAVLLAGGVVALVVGDVVGHGVAAAAAMGQLRAVLSDRLAANPDLGDALAEADRYAARTPGVRSATLAVLALDAASGKFWYATCGHPPPLVVAVDGSARFLPTTRGGPLGTGAPPLLAPGLLGPDELVLLFTNGVLSRPSQAATKPMAELAAAAAGAAVGRALPAGVQTAADRLCELTVELASHAGCDDDVLALAAHRLAGPVPALALELPGTLAAVRIARRALTPWLVQAGAVAADRSAIQLGIAELIINAAEHAYPPDGAGPIGLTCVLRDDGYVECRVSDHGTWRSPSTASDRGRGLMLVEHLLDDVVISHPLQVAGSPRGTRGTLVTLRHRLTRPAIATAGLPPVSCDDGPFSVDAENESAAARAVVYGAVDVFSAEEFTRELLAASRGGTLPLTVDLTEVSQLASAGVRALFEVRSQLAAHCQPMVLIAVPGSTAAFVLDLVQLSYCASPALAD
jgi:anti-sigma regulatory factor (Ser/Thr protein kinase)/anti-anti-sigma regulatory factor